MTYEIKLTVNNTSERDVMRLADDIWDRHAEASGGMRGDFVVDMVGVRDGVRLPVTYPADTR